jgi:4'-phosphopantetheinyl transferase
MLGVSQFSERGFGRVRDTSLPGAAGGSHVRPAPSIRVVVDMDHSRSMRPAPCADTGTSMRTNMAAAGRVGGRTGVESAPYRLAPRPGPALSEVFQDALPLRDWTTATQGRIVVVLVEPRDWHPWVPEALASLRPAERARVLRRRDGAGRDALALAYALHRMLLGAALGLDPAAVPLERDRNGCPRLLGGLAQTSLSHADGAIAFAVTRAGPVGIDLERASRAATMPEIADRICHPADVAALAERTGADRCSALLELWVRKEALLKAAGIGLAIEMDGFALAAGAVVAALPGLAIPATRVRMLEVGHGYVAAVAGPPEVTVDSRWLRPRLGTAG